MKKEFKQYRNTLTSVIRSAKNEYFKSKLQASAGNSKKTWHIVNSLLGKSDHSSNPHYITFHEQHISNDTEIAENFNHYFSNIASQLAGQIQQPEVHFKSYLPETAQFSFYLRPALLSEIKTIISNLKSSSAGFDDISIDVVKKCTNEISPFLVYIINRSFKEGCFPAQLQIARVIPVYKKGNKSSHNNYRPISILPSFSKIFEKVVVARLLDYITKCSLISDVQYGFRPTYSTELALYQLCHDIHSAIDSKRYQISVFCDLSKAFDSLSHKILLEKLEIYGIRGAALRWFYSYLSLRKQYTVYNGCKSSLTSVSYGVPQGSILGPVLFLLYINDITRCTDKLKFLLFADDTTIYIQGHDLNLIKNTLNSELKKVSNWIKSNELTLNISKTHCMLSSALLSKTYNIDVYIDNTPLKQVEECNFLGITLDSKLKFKSHISLVECRVSKLTGIFFKLRTTLTQDCIRQIYLSLVYPHLLYCVSIWGGTFDSFLNNLSISQKKLIRIMTYNHRFAHTDPLFKNLNLLKLHDIISMQTYFFVYKSLNHQSIISNFHYMQTNQNTRRPNTLRLPQCRTSHTQRFLTYRGANIWNNLPDEIKIVNNFQLFKTKIRNMFLNSY